MSTLYTLPGITGPHDVAPDARRTYGADGRDYGFCGPKDEPRASAVQEEYDSVTDTLTVWIPDD